MVKRDHTRHHETSINSIAKLGAKPNEQCDSENSSNSPTSSQGNLQLLSE